MLWASPAQPFGAMTDNVNELPYMLSRVHNSYELLMLYTGVCTQAMCISS